MKKFKFELEKILGLRKHREKETEIALAKARGVLNEIENKIVMTAAEKERISKEIPQGMSEIVAFDRYIQRLDKTKENLLVEAEKAQRKVNEELEIYYKASRERKVLDNIKEKRAQEYRKFVLAEETKVLDDLANGVKARKMAMG